MIRSVIFKNDGANITWQCRKCQCLVVTRHSLSNITNQIIKSTCNKCNTENELIMEVIDELYKESLD